MICRRALVRGLCVGTLLPSFARQAQPADKVWRIGIVPTGRPETVGHLAKAIEVSLANLGYVNGRNIAVVRRVAPPNPAEAERVLRETVPTIDILIVGGTMGGVVAKKVTTSLPTVFFAVGDPVRIGVVSSLAHPGGNMTGVTFEAAAAETYGKRLQILKEILPDLSVVGVLGATGDANLTVAMQALERVAPSLRVTLRSYDVKTVDDVNEAFATMTGAGVQAVLVVAGAFTYSQGRRIAQLALAHRLPSSHAFKETVADGGLVSLGADLVAMAPLVATYVDKIIKGAKPADLPVEQPTKMEFVINLKTAKALGLTIPQSLLLRADEIIQ